MAEDKPILEWTEIGSTGLRRYGQQSPIFEEFLKELSGQKACKTYNEMTSNDPTITGILFAIKMLCRRVPWRTKSASLDEKDEEGAEFLETCMHDLNHTWIDVIDEILSMLTYGYSVHEIVYKRRCGEDPDPSMRSKYADGRIGWRKLPIRAQETIYRWQFDDNGGIQGYEQCAPPTFETVSIPIEKTLLFRTTVEKNNPEGRSLFRGAYRSWFNKKNIENIEAIGVERDLAGLPMAFVPPEIMSNHASPGEKAILQEIKNIVVNVRRDAQEGLVMPAQYDTAGKPLYDFKLLSTAGTRQFNVNEIVNRYDQRIAMTVLADFILLGADKVGSFALASSKTKLFATAVGAFLDIIAEVFNRFAIPRLFKLNDIQVSEYPTITHGDLADVDLKEVGDYILKLSQAGMPLFPNAELQAYLMKVANMPEETNPELIDPNLEVESGTGEAKNEEEQGTEIDPSALENQNAAIGNA